MLRHSKSAQARWDERVGGPDVRLTRSVFPDDAVAVGLLDPKRVSVRYARIDVLRSKRGDRLSLVEPHERIELSGERRAGVVTHQLGVGPIERDQNREGNV